MKPTLFLNVGTGWSGTTPLYYTLGWYNKYCHSGHRKEKGYLWLMDLSETRNTFDRVKFYKQFFGPSKQSTTNRKPKIFTHESKYIGGNWTEDEIKYFWSPPFTIEKYIEYYIKHWDFIKHDYKAVSDFSNPNGQCSPEFLRKYAPALKSVFDVKIHVVFRDPLRRLWSLRQKQNPKDPVRQFMKMGVDFGYVQFFLKFVEAFGIENCHMTIMEEFWNGETKELSDFIDYEIKEVHPNAYVPDLGPNAPRIQYLDDQWESDIMHMPKEVKDYGLNMLKPVYIHFKDYFGDLPEQWSKL
tara:strand:+ start:5849 stop:6742 length:894 start_codon:yes stop_codon:yes gene_type:complete